MPRKTLDELLPPGQSPYFGMYSAGLVGYEAEEVFQHCLAKCIPLREKDVDSYRDGKFKHDVKQLEFERELARKRGGSRLNPVNMIVEPTSYDKILIRTTPEFEIMQLKDFPSLPSNWHGCLRRFFPCTVDNKPMIPWGWKHGFTPNLMTKRDAIAISPCGWVGQNMLYQPFIVIDIDGAGHGVIDQQVIDFGRQFQNQTMKMEDPAKKGSFHLYFETDHLIPVKHFPYAKLDLMGNAVNAAVYLKNKKSNGIPMMQLDDCIWNTLLKYVRERKQQCH